MINRLRSPEQIISSFQYTYDNVGNRTSMTTLSGTHYYNYDKINQLTNAFYPDEQQTEYQFDPLGNRTKVSSSSESSGTEAVDYTANWLNQYTHVGSTTLGYDQKGNLTNDGIRSYTYSCDNRLMEVATLDGTISYEYDALGRRAKKTTPDGIRFYIYDGYQVIMEVNESGAEVARYVYGVRIDEPITISMGSEVYYYHFDGLGSVTGITDSSGNMTESYSYDAYGKVVIRDKDGHVLEGSSVGNPYMFTGREYEQEAGLYYYRFRYYNTGVGRFLQPDPIGFADGDVNLYGHVKFLQLYPIGSARGDVNLYRHEKFLQPDPIEPAGGDLNLYRYVKFMQHDPIEPADGDLNLYRYVRNNPVNLVDPLGLWTNDSLAKQMGEDCASEANNDEDCAYCCGTFEPLQSKCVAYCRKKRKENNEGEE